MIGETRFSDGRDYECDDCKVKTRFKSYDAARDAGWSVGYFRDGCYCPKCAPRHRRGAAKKKTEKTLPAFLPKNVVQISIDNL